MVVVEEGPAVADNLQEIILRRSATDVEQVHARLGGHVGQSYRVARLGRGHRNVTAKAARREKKGQAGRRRRRLCFITCVRRDSGSAGPKWPSPGCGCDLRCSTLSWPRTVTPPIRSNEHSEANGRTKPCLSAKRRNTEEASWDDAMAAATKAFSKATMMKRKEC